MTKDTRVLFDKDYYSLQAVINSKKFEGMFAEFKKEMKAKGFPLPEKGFETAKEYHEWSNKAHSKDIYYEGFIEKVIREFKLEKNKSKLQLGLQWYVYFGKKKAPIKPTHAKLITLDDDKQSISVHITVYPWTRKVDLIDDLWERIEIEQQNLVEYKNSKRNREWDTFERDLRIYELFLNTKKVNSKSVYKRLVEDPEFKKIAEEYDAGVSIEESVGTIITRCKRNLGDINLI